VPEHARSRRVRVGRRARCGRCGGAGDAARGARARPSRRLGRLALQELLARRQIEQQIGHLDGGADRRPDLGDADEPTGLELDPGRGKRGVLARRQRHPGHARDRRQRLAAEAHAREAPQIVDLAQLGRRVALEREDRIARRHAAPVVGDPDERPAAGVALDRDRSRPGIEGVVQELLDHRCRTLDHLACGDLIDHVRR